MNNFVTTVFLPATLTENEQPQFSHMLALRDRMDGCEQSLELPCLINGASLNRGQMSGYAQAEGSWVSATGQVVNFVYQQSINGTSSNCWIYPTDCKDASLRYRQPYRLSTHYFLDVESSCISCIIIQVIRGLELQIADTLA